jgi:beta-phosphoglucomutase-like phosphatase (HAD superfamily)
MKIMLFDWNGTILDDIPIWYESVKEIFRVFGKRPPTIAEYFRELKGD